MKICACCEGSLSGGEGRSWISRYTVTVSWHVYHPHVPYQTAPPDKCHLKLEHTVQCTMYMSVVAYSMAIHAARAIETAFCIYYYLYLRISKLYRGVLIV